MFTNNLLCQGKLLTKQTKRRYTKVFDSLSENVLNCEYAVRGQIPIRGEQIMQEIRSNPSHHFPFSRTTGLNIGNP